MTLGIMFIDRLQEKKQLNKYLLKEKKENGFRKKIEQIDMNTFADR